METQVGRTKDVPPDTSGARTRGSTDLLLLGTLLLVVLGIFLFPQFLHGYTVPVGPDLPVYLWWARVGAAEGISLVGARPGTPVLIPTLASAFGIGLVPAVGGLQYAMGPAIAAAGAALLRGRGSGARPAWLAGGLLVGVWATHLGGGYVANLAFVAPFLAAAAALARRTRRGAVGSGILLAGGGLAHPQFFVVGVVILLVTAVWSVIADRGRRGDARRIVGAVGGSAAAVGAGVVAAAVGPQRLSGDTSKDAILRRLEVWSFLKRTYLERFRENWRRYAPIMNTGLVLAGIFQGHGFARRFLLGWIAFTAIALPLGVATGWYPPDRILTFAFCVPLLAALGLVWIGRRIGRWWLAWPVALVLILLTTLPTLRGWNNQATYLSPEELRDASYAGRIAETTPPGTPLVFVVNDPQSRSLFLLTHTLNVARAAVPPDRAPDVVVYLGGVDELLAHRPTHKGEPIYDAASRATLTDVPRELPIAVFVSESFDRERLALANSELTRWTGSVASTIPDRRPLPPSEGELTPSDPEGIGLSTVLTLLLLSVVGFGWSRWTMRDVVGAAATAPAFGVSVMIAVGLALERLGLSLGTTTSAWLISGLAGGSGYALQWFGYLRHRDDLVRQRLILQAEPESQA
jgi:hypothetical protein